MAIKPLPAIHVLTLSCCEVWARKDDDGETVLDLSIATPENAISLTPDDVKRLARLVAFIEMPPLS